MVEQWPLKPWAGGSNPPTLILATFLLWSGALAGDAPLENAQAAAEALVAGKSEEAASHLGKLLTFDLPPSEWTDGYFALICLRPPHLQKLLSRVPQRPWMQEPDLSRWMDLVRKVNESPGEASKLLEGRLETATEDPLLRNLLGLAREKVGMREEAIAEYERARKAAGRAMCFWINYPQLSLARLAREEDRVDDAYLLDSEVVSWLSELPDPREALARGDLAAGLAGLRDLAYSRSQLAMALSNVGYYHAQKEQHDAAIAFYRRSLAIEPRDARTIGNLAVSQYHSNDPVAALRSIEEALALDPENPDFKKEKMIIEAKLKDRR